MTQMPITEKKMVSLFINSWKNKYDSKNYPPDFYFQSLTKIRLSSNPHELAEYIIGLLHWKDGKVAVSQKGEYYLSSPKPNIYNPDKHKDVLFSKEFFDWAIKIIESNAFDPSLINELIGKPFELWSGGIVIPAFILHIISPTNYPLYDQHVERAKRALLAEELNEDFSSLSIETYMSYKKFFDSLVKELGTEYQKITIKEIKNIDEALWSFGKFLKDMRSNQIKQNKIIQQPIDHVQHQQRFTPDDDFKSKVVMYIKNGLTQKEAMVRTANERRVTLPDSYYKYPGSHIDRWKKQGHY